MWSTFLLFGGVQTSKVSKAFASLYLHGDPPEVVDGLAALHRLLGPEAVHEVKHEAHHRPRPPVPAPAVHVQHLPAEAQNTEQTQNCEKPKIKP